MQLNTRKKNMKLTVRENRLLRDTADLLSTIAGGAKICGNVELSAQAETCHEDLMVIIGDLLKLEDKEDGDSQSNRSPDTATEPHGTDSGVGKK